MSLLMQALRKAERARHGRDEERESAEVGAESLPSPPVEGGPAFGDEPNAWRLEPLDADPPVVAAQEAVHDPVPPQARHEPLRPSPSQQTPAPARPQETAARKPEARPDVTAQRRLPILAGALVVLLAVFAIIYWRAVSGPGPGARLPMVPMPAAGAPAMAPATAQQAAAIPVTPSAPPPDLQGVAEAPPVAAPVAVAAPAAAAPAPATRPSAEVTIPSPEQLAAIADPAIRAEAMRDAAERAARNLRAETGPASTPASRVQGEAAPPVEIHRPPGAEPVKPTTRAAAANAGGMHSNDTGPLRTAVGESGDVRFVHGGAAAQIAPSVQNGYAALKSGDLATARQQYDRALLEDPNSRDALLGSAAVALREHDGRQASGNYLRLLELDPNDPDALAGLSELHPGDLQTSETRLRGLARQHPESGPVQFALGNLFARQGRWPEAQQSYFRAVNAMPDNADYAFNLGVGLDHMNQPRLARTYYRRALELAQSTPPAFSIDAVHRRLQVLEAPPR
ncbi:tetratricopeptide repeat protein [Pseudoduganella violaceinigra]|uniref:tetratricopeptide repeat protein n=1 Tax=Pseudoduganella violaceinigra TaxID=246602 RepID=UPI000686D05A|nr:hypothetical protein [Pseudoduganella violaceinigra]